MRPPFRLYVISDRSRMDANPADAVAALARAGLAAFQWREKDLDAAAQYDWLARLGRAIDAARGPHASGHGPASDNPGEPAPQYPWQFAHAAAPAAPPEPAEPAVFHAWQQAHATDDAASKEGPGGESAVPPAFHLFVNDRADLALLAACHLHLGERSIPTPFARTLLPPDRLLGRSTHSLESALAAEREGADFITFGPVYDTPSKRAFGPPCGVPALRELCRAVTIPVFALGGVTLERIEACREAGAWGVAMIGAIWDAADRLEALAQAREASGDTLAH